MDKPIKIRPRPNVVVGSGKLIIPPPGTKRKRMHVLEAEARRRRLLLIGAVLIATLVVGVVIGRFLLP